MVAHNFFCKRDSLHDTSNSLSTETLQRHSSDYVFPQIGSGRTSEDWGWSTEWRVPCRWMVDSSVWPTARCHRSVTRTTTVLPTGRASSTLTILHWSPGRPRWSQMSSGPSAFQSSAASSKRHETIKCCMCTAQAELSVTYAIFTDVAYHQWRSKALRGPGSTVLWGPSLSLPSTSPSLPFPSSSPAQPLPCRETEFGAF